MNLKTYLINLDRSPERLEYMSKQLSLAGIAYEKIVAVDGKLFDFKDYYDDELASKLNGSSLADVEKGCALSHRRAMEKALEDNVDYALILEDDVEIPAHFKAIIEEILKRDRTSWEYISFNYPSVGIKYIRLWLFLFFGLFEKPHTSALYFKIPFYILKFIVIVIFSLFEGAREWLYARSYAYGKPATFYRPLYLAGCYLVSRKGLEKILSVHKNLIYPADRIQNVARVKKNLKLKHFVPLTVKQRRDKFKSTMNDLDLSSIIDVLN